PPTPVSAPAAAPPAGPAAETRVVEVVTQPAGARVVLVPEDDNGELRPDRAVRPDRDQRSPLRLHAPPGEHLLVVALDDGRFHEVYRRVPPAEQRETREPLDWWTLLPDGTVRLDPVEIPPLEVEKGMAAFTGGRFWMGPYCELYKATQPRHERQIDPFYLDTTEVTVAAYVKSGLGVPEQMRNSHPGPPPDFDQYPVSFVNF